MRQRDSGLQGFRKVRKDQSSICDDVIEQIEALIRDGVYRPGDRLPSERRLAERLGVGRYALREALRTLSSLGVLETRHGSGTHIADSGANLFELPFAFVLLLDRLDYPPLEGTRELIEIHLVGLAAERRTQANLADIEAKLRILQGAPRDPTSPWPPNSAFHLAIAAAAHSPVEYYLLQCLHRARVAYLRKFVTPDAYPIEYNETHERLFETIRDRNPEAARQAMVMDMKTARDMIRTAQAGERRQQEIDIPTI